MRLNCGFCQWSGSENDIFEHLECYHKNFLKEPKGNLYFDLTFDDLQQEDFVLCCSDGLYRFKTNRHQPRTNGIDFGVFHVGASAPVEYKLKLGINTDGRCEYWGPYTSLLDTNDDKGYNIKFDFEYLEIINETMPSKRLRIFFGTYGDNDDKLYPGQQDVEWNEEDELLNRLCEEHFTCPICFEYICRDARLCENKHFICLNCFDQILQRKKLECPFCRGLYLYDCVQQDVECLLRLVKWSDMPKVGEHKKMLEYLKSLPNIKFVKGNTGSRVEKQ